MNSTRYKHCIIKQPEQAVDKESSRKSLMRMRNKSSVVSEACLGDTKKCGIFYSYI